jgi:hypothetical protein
MRKRKIDNCPVCEPISLLLESLEAKGLKIIESKLVDYHFHEMYFKVSNIGNVQVPKIEKIKKHSSSEYVCECHLSTVELV